MSDPPSSSTSTASTRGRGRGKSRGGLGKYLRARGRGRGGRPAEFSQRLLLEGEGKVNLTEEEETELKKELTEKYSRRQLGTNADRYKEEAPELDSDGEPIVEPEVDLSGFLERQRLSDANGPALVGTQPNVDDDDVDTSLAHISSNAARSAAVLASKKGKLEQVEWSEELADLTREKQAAEAKWDLKDRFKAKSDRLRAKPITPAVSSTSRSRKHEYQDAPALPLPEGTKSKSEMDQLEDFLDDLLT